MLVSLIIPSYNPDFYFSECLQSVANQTLDKKRFEVIIVINGCTIDSVRYILKQCEFFAQKINIKILYAETAGAANARNIGLRYASGNYICFLDDDDLISENYLMDLLEKVEKEKNAIVVSNVYAFSDSITKCHADYITKSFLRYADGGAITKKIKVRSFFSSSCCKIIPKDVIAGRKFDSNFKIGEDSLFMALISDRVCKVIFANKDTIYYRRIRITSISHENKSRMRSLELSICISFSFLKIYFSKPFQYNLLFFMNRIIAPFHRVFSL